MTHLQPDEGHCCPVFDPEPWDRKTREWQERLPQMRREFRAQLSRGFCQSGQGYLI